MTTLQLPLNNTERVDVEGSGYSSNDFLAAGGVAKMAVPKRAFVQHVKDYPRKLTRFDVYEQNKLWMVVYCDFTRDYMGGWLECAVGTVLVDGFAGHTEPQYRVPYYC